MRPTLNEPVGVGTAMILRRDGHVLLGRRKNAHGAGLWSFPGGKPDPGESPEDAAIRETFEEAGIRVPLWGVSPLPYWSYDRFEEDDLHYVTLFFQAGAPADGHATVMEPEKCEEWRWFSIQAARALKDELFPGTDEALRRIVA